MSTDPDRWLVTINGHRLSERIMNVHGQRGLALYLCQYGHKGAGGDACSEFLEPIAAHDFHGLATREFPADDVRLWASVNTTTTER